jgi:hypothetical protein
MRTSQKTQNKFEVVHNSLNVDVETTIVYFANPLKLRAKYRDF